MDRKQNNSGVMYNVRFYGELKFQISKDGKSYEKTTKIDRTDYDNDNDNISLDKFISHHINHQNLTWKKGKGSKCRFAKNFGNSLSKYSGNPFFRGALKRYLNFCSINKVYC